MAPVNIPDIADLSLCSAMCSTVCSTVCRTEEDYFLRALNKDTLQHYILHGAKIDCGLHLTQTYPGSFLRFVTKYDEWSEWQCSHVYISEAELSTDQHSHNLSAARGPVSGNHKGIQKV